MGIFSIFSKKNNEQQEEEKKGLNHAVEKTKDNFFSKITKAVAGKSEVDEEVLDNIEEALIASDVGINTTIKIIEKLEARVAKDKYVSTADLNQLLKEEITSLLKENNTVDTKNYTIENITKPHIIMVVGVNGVGKTTTIGKLAKQFKNAGQKVILGAADTFRAAAIDQLDIWAKRTDVEIIKHNMGSDPGAVAFDTVKSAVAKNVDIAIIDTAGRLHNKVNLMNELSKVKRVMAKVIPDAPHEIILVLDASTGQNAIEQAKQFINATEVTGIALTKLDGTAKGGVILGIVDQFKIPIKYIGVGEKIDDLQLFNSGNFIDSLFKN